MVRDRQTKCHPFLQGNFKPNAGSDGLQGPTITKRRIIRSRKPPTRITGKTACEQVKDEERHRPNDRIVVEEENSVTALDGISGVDTNAPLTQQQSELLRSIQESSAKMHREWTQLAQSIENAGKGIDEGKRALDELRRWKSGSLEALVQTECHVTAVAERMGTMMVAEGQVVDPPLAVNVKVTETVNKDGEGSGGYHGRLCGVYSWLRWKHGKWRFGEEQMELVGLGKLKTWLLGDDLLVNDGTGRREIVGEQGAVLRLLQESIRQHTVPLEWRHTGTFGARINDGRHLEIERNKRKPPWQKVAME